MKIGGFQKLTLLDYPGHTACTVFTVGCNMRCPFCYNTPLVLGTESAELIAEEEIFAFLEKRRGLLDGVCITGGEPTLQPGLGDFVAKVRDMGYAIKLDTNGLRPDVLGKLLSDGMIDYAAMDIKSSKGKYHIACGIEDVDTGAVERSVSLLMERRIPFELRTTVSRELHDAETMRDIGRWIVSLDAKKELPGRSGCAYFIQSYKDMPELVGGGHLTAYSAGELEELLLAGREFLPEARLRGVEC